MSSTITFKAGDSLAISGVDVYFNSYKKTSESSYKQLVAGSAQPSALTVSPDGSFEYLIGASYGGGFICLIDGDYTIKNTAYNTTINIVVPDR